MVKIGVWVRGMETYELSEGKGGEGWHWHLGHRSRMAMKTVDRDSTFEKLLDCEVWVPDEDPESPNCTRKCPVTWMDGKGNGLVVYYKGDGSVSSRMIYVDGRMKIQISNTSVIMDGRNLAIKRTLKDWFK